MNIVEEFKNSDSMFFVFKIHFNGGFNYENL